MIALLDDVTPAQWVAFLTPLFWIGVWALRLKVKNTALGSALQLLTDTFEAGSRSVDQNKADAFQAGKEVIATVTRGTRVEGIIHRAAKEAEKGVTKGISPVVRKL